MGAAGPARAAGRGSGKCGAGQAASDEIRPGTWIELSGTSNRFIAAWTAEGDTLVRFADGTGKRAEFQIYDILGSYYYVAYTDSSWHAYLLQRKG